MSTTTSTLIPPIGQPNITTGAPTTPADQAVGIARDVPDLIQKASMVAPDLASKWTGQSLIASRSPWGTLAGGVVGWLVTKYGLGWDQSTCDLVAGGCVLVASYAMRYVTENPITGWFRKATVGEAMATAATTTAGATP